MDAGAQSSDSDPEGPRFPFTAPPFKPQARVWVSGSWLARYPNRARVSR